MKPQPFDAQAVVVLGELRAAMASVIAAIPGKIKRAADLQRATQIDPKLSWRLLRVARAANPLAAGPYVPGRASIRTFLKAAARVGVRQNLLSAVETSSNEFERLVSAHAGDRSAFDSMVAALARGGDADQSNLRHRRAAFRANRHLWGIQATAQLKCVFTDSGDDPAKVNVAVVDGYVSLRQLRSDAPMIVTCARVADDQGAPLPVERHPIDHRAIRQHGFALLADYCSDPLPQLREVQAAGGFAYGQLVSCGVGNNGAITCFTGWRASNVASRYRAPNNLGAVTHGAVRIPCEAITICLLTRAGLFGGAAPQLAVYSDHMAELPYPIHTHRMDGLLLPDDSVTYLGRGTDTLSVPEIPQLPEMAQYVFDQLGWDAEQFDVHCCRIAYPIMPSTVAISFDLPETPGS